MFKKIGLALVSLSCLLLINGCNSEAPRVQQTITILAGSELADLEPKLGDIRNKTGISIEFKYIGTLDGAEALVSGEDYDLAWFSHAKYLSLLQGNDKVIQASERIGLSPVIPAVKESLAKQWGWDSKPVTWADIAEKTRSGEFNYGMTDPTASNSGFSAVLGVQAAFSNSSDVITVESLDTEKLEAFFSGQALVSGSSGWLAEAYVRDQDTLAGLFNYESVILSMNQSNELEEKLIPVYPTDGVVTADYPLLLINEQKRDAFDLLVDYLKSEETQQWLMDETFRRPVVPAVKLNSSFSQRYLMELPFPADIDTVNELLFSYLNEHKKPNTSIFVLDLSGSMNWDGRMDQLRSALLSLSGNDTSVSGQFTQFRHREHVIMIPFNDRVMAPAFFEVEGDESLQEIKDYVNGLNANRGTAIYDALIKAYEIAEMKAKEDSDRMFSIVLMTDGDNNHGRTLRHFQDWYAQQEQDLANVRTFPILFGESNEREMTRVSEITGGRNFDARKHSLTYVMKQIRGYQ
ncbi:substrate-binding domain-containing protein [Vibrio sp. WXL210]|uniref:vWA domain-containing protein n=1 Tax=Vibrio sp. WXL210 TaxID=3450709 RepID=UPI003EC91F0D